VKMLILSLLVTGCTATGMETPKTITNAVLVPFEEKACDAALVQYAIGRKTSSALAQELMAKAGASILRWIPPRTAVTMDYSPVRLNISYDDEMVIDRINCG
jgi:Peptidase inhibitor I78 family